MAFLGLNASTQLAGLDTASQGVARPTNGGFGKSRSDNTTNGKVGGGGGGTPPPTGR